MSISPAALVVLVALYPSPVMVKRKSLHLAVLGSFEQLHISGFHFQIEVAHHLVGNRRAVGGKVLGAAPVTPSVQTTTPLRWALIFSAFTVTEPLRAWLDVMVSWLPSTEKFSPAVLLVKV